MNKRNITRLAFAIVILSFVLSTFVSLWSLRIMAERNIQELSKTLASRIYDSISNELSEPVTVSLAMANDTLLKDVLKNEASVGIDETSNIMSDYLSGQKNIFGYEAAFVVSDASMCYYSYGGINKQMDPIISDRDKWYSRFLLSGKKYEVDVDRDEVSQDQWTVFEGTQEPIIDQETFDTVQRIRSQVRRYPNGWGPAHPLTGLLICSDCGHRLYEHRNYNGSKNSLFVCGQYGKLPIGSKCPSGHRVFADTVMKLLSEILRACAEYVHIDREQFMQNIQQEEEALYTEEQARCAERIRVAQTRANELEKLICRIYEDHILDKIPDERYEALDRQYSQELKRMKEEITACEAVLAEQAKRRGSAGKFADLFDNYHTFDNLTSAIVHQFVDKIVVHERTIKGSQTSPQQIDIYFNFVGNFIPPNFGDASLTPEQEEEQKMQEERREKFKQNYQKRKANGKQQEYEERTKEHHRAMITAKKDEYRREAIANGVYTPVQPILQPQKGVAAS